MMNFFTQLLTPVFVVLGMVSAPVEIPVDVQPDVQQELIELRQKVQEFESQNEPEVEQEVEEIAPKPISENTNIKATNNIKKEIPLRQVLESAAEQPQNPEPFKMPDKFINPETGKPYGIKEYGEMMAEKMMQDSLKKARMDMYDNIMNDGTAYTVDELNSIDCAYLGINCPTINVNIRN
jgi:hypothetical protein